MLISPVVKTFLLGLSGWDEKPVDWHGECVEAEDQHAHGQGVEIPGPECQLLNINIITNIEYYEYYNNKASWHLSVGYLGHVVETHQDDGGEEKACGDDQQKHIAEVEELLVLGRPPGPSPQGHHTGTSHQRHDGR